MSLRHSLLCGAFCFFAAAPLAAQETRPRIIASSPVVKHQTVTPNIYTVERSAPPTAQQSPRVRNTVLTNDPMVVRSSSPTNAPLVRSTAAVRPAVASAAATAAVGLAMLRPQMEDAMTDRLGIPYHYGSTGPNTYDCSGLVWSVFRDAGVDFERSSARTFWNTFETVAEDEQYKFGTLVFFNGLGHVGIVIDENTFYHASSSKGVTYSPFKGYWSKRITGFRRVPVNQLVAVHK